MHSKTNHSKSKARHLKRWKASPFSAATWTIMELRLLTSEPSSVRHEQPSIS
ncbi:hypothetical protein DPMN_054877 [Dreissena polymorpha]|uniref:Uncharacterized protein n=1 Tax=Dreissena polymorpha TaxID=45954 RepID=A0A9D4CNX4_DREPO|nr:hypothetical protein DPMN_054877 [Dreissena polymorpha]